MKAISLIKMCLVCSFTINTLQANEFISRVSAVTNKIPLKAACIATGAVLTTQHLVARYYYKNTEKSWTVQALKMMYNTLHSKELPSCYRTPLITALSAIERFNNPSHKNGYISNSLCNSVMCKDFDNMNLDKLKTSLLWSLDSLSNNRDRIETTIKTLTVTNEALEKDFITARNNSTKMTEWYMLSGELARQLEAKIKKLEKQVTQNEVDALKMIEKTQE